MFAFVFGVVVGVAVMYALQSPTSAIDHGLTIIAKTKDLVTWVVSLFSKKKVPETPPPTANT